MPQNQEPLEEGASEQPQEQPEQEQKQPEEDPETPIQMENVMGSSSVDSMGYDDKTGVMVVQYRNGRQYKWLNIPRSVYDQLRASESVGKALRLIEREYGTGYRIG
jgi:hypothetical protein